MSRQYTAFISYRHARVDSRVAAEVQRSLERFHIPAAVRRKTGVKSLAPVFRDKEELPVTAEISGDIGDALAHSSHLIVICSPRTAESAWVQREIEAFLKTHPIEDVLTVLAEGEPHDVIPAMLLRRPTVVELEDGTTQEVMVEAEPLSCDFRSARKRDHRAELMRLAAAMLGVPSASLARRQQRYRRRLATAAALAAFAVMAYGGWSLVTIREDYRQTQREQSRALARDAQELYDEGRTTEAVELALAALPGEGGDRPLVPQAELALQRATRAYVAATSKPTLDRTAVQDYGVSRSFPLGHEVSGMRVSEDGALLVAWSHSGDLACWDVPTGKKVFELHRDRLIQDAYFPGGDALVVSTSDELMCVRPSTGQKAWHLESTPDTYSTPKNGGTPFNHHLDHCMYDDTTRTLVVVDKDAKTALLIDPKNGSVTKELDLSEILPDKTWVQDVVANHGTLAILNSTDQDDSYALSLVDLQTGKVCRSEHAFQRREGDSWWWHGICILSKDRVLTREFRGCRSGRYNFDDRYFPYTSLEQYELQLSCLDATTGKTLWTQSVPFWQEEATISTPYMSTFDFGDGEQRDALVLCESNRCIWLDPETGTILGSIETPADFVNAWPARTRELEEDDTRSSIPNAMEGCLSGGVFTTCYLGDQLPSPSQRSRSIKHYPTEIQLAETSAAGEFIAARDTVYLYGMGQADNSWHELWTSVSSFLGAGTDLYFTGFGLVSVDCTGCSNGDVPPSVALFDLADCKMLWETMLSEHYDRKNRIELVGIAQDAGLIVFERTDADSDKWIVMVSLEDGRIDQTRADELVPAFEDGEQARYGGYVTANGNHLVSIAQASGSPDRLCVTDLTNMESTILPVETDGGYRNTRAVLSESDWLLDTTRSDLEGDIYVYQCHATNIRTGESWDLDESVTKDLAIWREGSYHSSSYYELDGVWGPDGSLYVATRTGIAAYKGDGSKRFSVDIGDEQPVGMGLCNDGLWLCTWHGGSLTLRWYDTMTGSPKGECQPSIELDADDEVRFVDWCDLHDPGKSEEGQFVLRVIGLYAGETAVVIDHTGQVYQQIENCLTYDPGTDSFVVRVPDPFVNGFGVFRRYGLEELVERGQDVLGDSRMSEEQRQEYGL